MRSAAHKENADVSAAPANDRGRLRRRSTNLCLTFAAQLEQPQPDTAQDAARRFRGVAYSGGVIPNYGFLGDIAIDLDSLRNADGDELPVLAHHDRTLDAIAGRGVIRRVRTDAGLALEVEGELTDSTEVGRQVQRLLAERLPLQLSLGLSGSFREIGQGKTVRVNGRQLAVAGLFENALVREVSFVPVGADPDTSADALFSIHKETAMSVEDEAAALRTRIAELEAEIERLRSQRRMEQVTALMQDVGRPLPTGETLDCYLKMSDDAFAVFASELRAVSERFKKLAAVEPKLFHPVSTRLAAAEGDEAIDGAKRRAERLMAAVKNMSRI